MTISISACKILSVFALIHGSVFMSNAALGLVRQLDAAFVLGILIEPPKSARSQNMDMYQFYRTLITMKMY